MKQSLQELGSDLVILNGPMETALPDLVSSLQATSIVLEEEVEYRCAAYLGLMVEMPVDLMHCGPEQRCPLGLSKSNLA